MVHAAANNLVVGEGTTFYTHLVRVMSLDVINALCMERSCEGWHWDGCKNVVDVASTDMRMA